MALAAPGAAAPVASASDAATPVATASNAGERPRPAPAIGASQPVSSIGNAFIKGVYSRLATSRTI